VSAATEREPLCLVDGSGILFRAFHALPPLTTRQGTPTGAVYGFTSMLTKLLREKPDCRIVVVFDAPGKTFRDEADERYKATRSETPADLRRQIPYVKRIVKALGLPLLEVEGVEADDVIGTLARRAVAETRDVHIVTSDKDMMQLVGPRVRLIDTMYDRVTGEDEVRERFGVGPGQVVEVMGLMGDSIDNIPGVRGVGEKTAKALIGHFGSIDAMYERLDELGGLGLRGAARLRSQLEAGREDAIASRFLATIRCDLEIDFDETRLAAHEPDQMELRELSRELEFAKLLAEYLDGSEAPESAQKRTVRVAAPGEIEALLEGASGVAVGIAFVPSTPGIPPRAASVALAAIGGEEILTTAPGESLRQVLSGRGPGVVLVDDLKQALHASGLDGEDAREVGAAEVQDALLLSYLLDPSRRGHGIDALASERLGRTLPSPKEELSAAERAGAIAGTLLDVGPALRAEIAAQGLESLYRDVELPLARVLARIESHGILVDREVLERIGAEFSASVRALEREIHELAGGPFNIGSTQQLREVLFDRLKLPTKGVRRGKTGLSVDADVLAALAEKHPLPAKIVEHRALSKLLSTYVSGLLPLVDAKTGRLHTSFNQAVAATGRLSSSDPNLQNIPVRTAEGRRIREAFVPPPGWRFLAGDYSQIELRVLAHLTEDPVLVEAFRSGEDIHRRTAAEVFAVAPEAVTSEMRNKAKVINFGILYGMGPQRLSRELSIPLAEAETYIRRYFERYECVREFADRVVAGGREVGYVETLIGRRRYLPELLAREPNRRQAAERMAWNSPIQGTAADIIKLAMLSVDRVLAAEGASARMLLQVHDELLFEVPEAEMEATGRLVREHMESVVALAVPLAVDLKTGPNWAGLR